METRWGVEYRIPKKPWKPVVLQNLATGVITPYHSSWQNARIMALWVTQKYGGITRLVPLSQPQ